MPKVSIIIPIYNVEEYLRECLDSAINQTLTDIEIICIEDCSTDSSSLILSEYASLDNRIVVISNKINSGLSCSRNIGIRVARGEYIQFLDADDRLLEDAVEQFYEIAKKDDLDFLKAGYILNNIITGSQIRVEGYVIEGVHEGKELLVKMEQKHNYHWQAWVNFVKRDFLCNNDIFFCEGILHEDLLYTYKLHLFAKRCAYLTDCKYVYKKRPLSITTIAKSSKHLYGYLISMNEVLKEGLKNEQEIEFWYATLSYWARMYRNGLNIRNQIYGEISTEGWEREVSLLYDMLYKSNPHSYIDFDLIMDNKDTILNSEKVLIYGAGKAAEQLVRKFQENNFPIDGVAVTELKNSNTVLFGHRVHNIDDFYEHREKSLVLVAITPKYVGNVLQDLCDKGFENVLYVCKQC